MKFQNVFIPYGGYWSTPFVRWQGSFSHLNAVPFAGEIVKQALKERNLEPTIFDSLSVGLTVPQRRSFFAGPWLAALIGAPGITGPTLSQACATGARVVSASAMEVETGLHNTVLAVLLDRCSNAPHLVYPNQYGPGGLPESEDWMWDNFQFDPHAKNAMIDTAENVAREAGITKEQQDEMILLRYSQYQEALKDDRAFQRRYMVSPIEVKDASGRKVIATVKGDEGVFGTTKEGLAKLKPAKEGGSVTFGGQTFPADANAAIVLTTREKAKELSREPNIEVRLVSVGTARVKKGFMPQAPVPAAQKAIENAGISVADVRAYKTHNPFAVNDVYFYQQLGIKPESVNRFGSSLIYGHPQAPTGARLMIELIEELALYGGGYGVFSGCAAGDSAMACVIQVR
jgi:acetyl-CoA acetyltransferase family protein